MNKEELEAFRKRLSELEEEILKDPELQRMCEKLERELGRLSHEDLHRVIGAESLTKGE